MPKPKGPVMRYSPEFIEWVRSIAPGRPYVEILQLINERLAPQSLREAQLIGIMKNHNIKNGRVTQFKRGFTPPNKGKKMPLDQLERLRKSGTWFTKGAHPHNELPVGSEVVDAEGYHKIKVSDVRGRSNQSKRWKFKHVYIWEQAHGPVPKGSCVIFLDGNKENIALENLALVSKQMLVRINNHGFITSDPELTKTGINIAKVMNAIGKRKKK